MNKQGAVELINIDKYYEKNHVVKNLSFKVEAGEFISLLGPSGCGKSTILRMIAGFEYMNQGQIKIDGERIDDKQPYKRKLNTIFQNYALFPNLTVYQNIEYGLKAEFMPKAERKKRVEEAIEMVQLKGFEDRLPSQMSGGQKQRVAIARAIVKRPPLLLLDEPLTALDLKLRKQMRLELRQIQQKLGITFIYVTHDQEEALVMSDRIAIMNKGKIEQFGTPYEIYSKPVSQFVAEFIGETNTFEAVAFQGETNHQYIFKTEFGYMPGISEKVKPHEIVNISIRPDCIKYAAEPIEGFEVRGQVTDQIFIGAFSKTIVTLANGKEVKITRLAGEEMPQLGDLVYLYWDINDAVIMQTMSQIIHSTIENVDMSSWTTTA